MYLESCLFLHIIAFKKIIMAQIIAWMFLVFSL